MTAWLLLCLLLEGLVDGRVLEIGWIGGVGVDGVDK